MTVLSGAESGKTLELSTLGDRKLLGKSPVCDLALSDALVSRRHLALEIVSAGLRALDVGSTNGTFLGAVRVVDAVLGGGEILRIGGVALQVTRLPDVAEEQDDRTAFGPLLGRSARMRKLYPLCERLAQSNVPVVIEGETGTGKEVLAEALHLQGDRAKGPFVVFDCTAVAPSLLEAALFGHEKGAFTGASISRVGVFEEARGGTLLIDEIGDLDLALQAKLLRAIQKSEIRRIGATAWTKVDVRVMAATRRDLDREVQDGRFRDDLFFRLAVARIELPPLRDRREDIEHLARHFWTSMGGDAQSYPPGLLAPYEGYAWPGNVRELQNVVARAYALGDMAAADVFEPDPDSRIGTPRTGGDFIDQVVAQDLPLADARDKVVVEFERRYLTHVLDKHGGSVAKAAAAAGVARRYMRLLRARTRGA